MFPIIREVSRVLENYLAKNISENKTNVFEFRDVMARFNTSIISSIAFGIDSDCINEPDHIFKKMGTQIFRASLGNAIRGIFALMLPNQFHNVGLRTVDCEVEEFLFKVVKETVEFRERHNYSRNDLMQLLIQLKNQGYVSTDKNESEKDNDHHDGLIEVKKLTLDELAANMLMFFAAGKNKH